MELFTVGYEGCDIEEFTTALKKAGVKQVADLRKNPVSRKRGFSKRLMGEALAEKKIEYIHLPGLGVPTEWRKQAKEEIITRQKMFKDYVQKILPKQQEDIEVLHTLLAKKGLALLCYEADASDCHRRYVADEMIRTSKEKITVNNLQVKPAVKLFKLPKPGAVAKPKAAIVEPAGASKSKSTKPKAAIVEPAGAAKAISEAGNPGRASTSPRTAKPKTESKSKSKFKGTADAEA